MPLPHGEPPPRLAGTHHAVPPHNKESHTRTVCLRTGERDEEGRPSRGPGKPQGTGPTRVWRGSTPRSGGVLLAHLRG
ncbi:hypothetical protein AB0I02_35770 [Streptomyces phaeochromogenes]